MEHRGIEAGAQRPQDTRDLFPVELVLGGLRGRQQDAETRWVGMEDPVEVLRGQLA
jgi:hypothetical protein